MKLKKNKNYIVGVLYRHPKQNLIQFLHTFETVMEKLNSSKETYYISGDFNIDLIQNEKNNSIKNYTDMIYSLGCIPLIHYPTRITSTSSTLLITYTQTMLLTRYKAT